MHAGGKFFHLKSEGVVLLFTGAYQKEENSVAYLYGRACNLLAVFPLTPGNLPHQEMFQPCCNQSCDKHRAGFD